MANVGIICEYNPFHNGHAEQLRKADELLGGEHNTKLALMSGSYVQRGEPAILSKELRTRAALSCGVDLVFEYPFPYSCAPAKIFADCAVGMFDRLGCVDYLCFGSETGDAGVLSECADVISSDAFEKALSEDISDFYGKMSYAAVRERVYKRLTGNNLPIGSNDILAVEYLIALKKRGSKIKPLVIKRVSGFGATAARKRIMENEPTTDLLPEIMSGLIAENKTVQIDDFSKTLLPFLRLSDPERLAVFADMSYDLACKLVKASMRQTSVSALVECAANKTYTRARIRRAIFLSFFGVTPDRLHAEPKSIRLLGANECGRKLLRQISECSEIEVVTTARASDDISDSNDFSLVADSVYALVSGENRDVFDKKPLLM